MKLSDNTIALQELLEQAQGLAVVEKLVEELQIYTEQVNEQEQKVAEMAALLATKGAGTGDTTALTAQVEEYSAKIAEQNAIIVELQAALANK